MPTSTKLEETKLLDYVSLAHPRVRKDVFDDSTFVNYTRYVRLAPWPHLTGFDDSSTEQMTHTASGINQSINQLIKHNSLRTSEKLYGSRN